ncbi:MAG: hypothetical protein JO180_01550 [Gemmatirosa sp.]|nr:hypothetical protein [Gemmatirosa sp.]
MDCRAFHKYHLAYLDDTLPGELMGAAEYHLVTCETCAAHDTAVRRGLLLARNLPSIELSADFSARLAARLDEVRCGRCDVPTDGLPLDDWTPSRTELIRAALAAPFGGTLARRAAIAAGLLALTYASSRTLSRFPTSTDELLAPAVAEASVPAPLPMLSPAALASPALVSSASTGIPVWPAALLADQAPTHMVEPQLASW